MSDGESLQALAARCAATLNGVAGQEIATVDLLLRPPFRFLHDVVMTVQRVTGFPDQLWCGIELDAVALRSTEGRDGKLRFVKKLIAVVWHGKGFTGPPTVRASKILAGLEPENTNRLLEVGGLVALRALRRRLPHPFLAQCAYFCWPATLPRGGL